MTPVRLLPAARANVIEAAAYMNARHPGRGDRFTAAVQRFADNLSRFPQLYAKARRSPRGREIREGVVARFKYIVTYEVFATEVVILSIGHGSLRTQPWRRPRP